MDYWFDEMNIEEYLAAVRKHRILWDNRSEDFHDRTKKREAWYEICKELLDDFDLKDNRGQSEVCNRLAKKWRNIRDNYVKCQKKGTKYVYERHLKFISGIVRRRRPKNSIYDEYVVRAEDETTADPLNELSETQSEDNETFYNYNSPACERKATPPSTNPFETGEIEVHDEFIEQKVVGQCVEPEEVPSISVRQLELQEVPEPQGNSIQYNMYAPNADRAFFESLLPSISDFDEDEKLKFRANVLDMVRKMRKAKRLKKS